MMLGPKELFGPEDLEQQLKALVHEEQELEKLRAILAPNYWPRVYPMLDRIRKQIRDIEKYLGSGRDAA